MPTVSVILPVYNDERFVGAAIESILAQSFRDFEFLVVNDGSTDGTGEVLGKFFDPRLTIVTQTNKGIVQTLNLAISMAKGKYIARMDSDDFSRINRFCKQVDFLDANPECGLVGSACEIVREDGTHMAHFSVPHQDEAIRRSMVWRNPFVHSSIMVRKSVLDRVGGYKQSFDSIGHDYELWWRVLAVTKAANLGEELVIRTHRCNSTFRIRKDIHYQFMWRIIFDAFRKGYAPRFIMAVSLGRTACYYAVHRLLWEINFYLSDNTK
ncbi:MAG: glycosyltransferase [Deltaproteobacteria bacterium]|nr:glycosyltransferase [Deltaproteobacteria bacterium]